MLEQHTGAQGGPFGAKKKKRDWRTLVRLGLNSARLVRSCCRLQANRRRLTINRRRLSSNRIV